MSRVFRFRSHRRTGIFRNLAVSSAPGDEFYWYEPVTMIQDTRTPLSNGLHDRDGHLS